MYLTGEKPRKNIMAGFRRKASSWHRFYLAKAKLQASSKTSALLAGFVLVSMVEAHLDNDIPAVLLISFAICTTLVVAIHLLALFISTCILPHIDAVDGSNYSDDERQIVAAQSPHVRLGRYIELAWILSTGVGILLFLVQMCVLAWMRFSQLNLAASVLATAVIVPAIVVFMIFAVHFYRQLIAHKYERVTSEINELENEVQQLEMANRTTVDVV